MITFHLQDGKLRNGGWNTRPESYPGIFGPNFVRGQSARPAKIYTGNKRCFGAYFVKDFLIVTDRRRPVLFTEFYDSGTARFAQYGRNSVFADDAPALETGSRSSSWARLSMRLTLRRLLRGYWPMSWPSGP